MDEHGNEINTRYNDPIEFMGPGSQESSDSVENEIGEHDVANVSRSDPTETETEDVASYQMDYNEGNAVDENRLRIINLIKSNTYMLGESDQQTLKTVYPSVSTALLESFSRLGISLTTLVPPSKRFDFTQLIDSSTLDTNGHDDSNIGKTILKFKGGATIHIHQDTEILSIVPRSIYEDNYTELIANFSESESIESQSSTTPFEKESEEFRHSEENESIITAPENTPEYNGNDSYNEMMNSSNETMEQSTPIVIPTKGVKRPLSHTACTFDTADLLRRFKQAKMDALI